MKKIQTILLLAAVIVVGVLVWKHFFPNEEKRVRKMLTSLAEDVSVSKQQKTLGKLLSADSIAGYFTPNAAIDVDIPEMGRHTISGRQEIVQVALAAQTQFPGLQVSFEEIAIRVDAGRKSATAELTAKVFLSDRREFGMQDVRLTLTNYNGDWRIARAETVQAFK